MNPYSESGLPVIKPGIFSFIARADTMRMPYDASNEQILYHQKSVYFDFIGESITQFWDLQVYFGSSGKFNINRGISGDITPMMLRRFEADVVQLQPCYVHILGGTNNTWRLGAVDARERRTPEQIYSEILIDTTSMVQLAKSSGITPIVASNLPSGTDIPCFDFWPTAKCANETTGARNELLAASNASLSLMAQREQIIYVDYFSHMTGPDGRTLRPELSDDSLHPNVQGYNVMADVLRRTLALHRIEL